MFISAEVPGVTTKNSQPDTARKDITLWRLDRDYNISVWTHVYTDGSSNTSVRNGGSMIRSGKILSRSPSAGVLPNNYWAKLAALHETARLLSAETPPLSYTVFLTDCKSAVQSLQSLREQLQRDTLRLLCDLLQHSRVAV